MQQQNPIKTIDVIESRDIYEIAFYMCKTNCKIKKIRFTDDLDKPLCLLTVSGESLKAYQLAYLNSDTSALVDPISYRKNLGYIRSIITGELRKNQKQNGGKL